MQTYLPYLLMPVMAGLLVAAQALWGTVIKNEHALQGTPLNIVMNLVSSPRMWLGALIYVAATLVYFFMLSKLRFFSVQIGMTALSIIFSTALSILLFHETPTALNIAGAVMVLVGVGLVLVK